MSGRRLDVLVHELRSPVAALAAIAGAYATADPPQRQRLRELAAAAVDGIGRLLEDAAGSSIRLAPLDAGKLALEVAETAALGGDGVVATAEPGLIVHGDADRLRQALSNLVENAVGHTPPGGTVRVSATEAGETVVIAVADEGDGVAPADQERVFDAGVRLTVARPGSGLGLAVVREIARAHGGDVLLESAAGEGATFRLVLPRASVAP